MVTKVLSAAISGVDSKLVEVEVESLVMLIEHLFIMDFTWRKLKWRRLMIITEPKIL